MSPQVSYVNNMLKPMKYSHCHAPRNIAFAPSCLLFRKQYKTITINISVSPHLSHEKHMLKPLKDQHVQYSQMSRLCSPMPPLQKT